jgi:hypothetical protein
VHRLKNRGPLLVSKIRGYFDKLPDWFQTKLTIRVESRRSIPGYGYRYKCVAEFADAGGYG